MREVTDCHTWAASRGLRKKIIDFLPSFHPRCRCATMPWFDDEFTADETRTARNPETGKSCTVEDMTYSEWKEKFVDGVDSGGESGIINYSRDTSLFKVEGIEERFTPEQVLDDLQTSNIGQEIAKALDTLPQAPIFDYGIAEDGVKAEEVKGTVKVYMQNCKDIKTAACALIHEMTHYRYGIGQSQWSECVCVCQELKHRRQRDYLTFAEKCMVVKAVRAVYPEYNWRKGGLLHGRRVN